jgi:hypothetical protein
MGKIERSHVPQKGTPTEKSETKATQHMKKVSEAADNIASPVFRDMKENRAISKHAHNKDIPKMPPTKVGPVPGERSPGER